MVVGDRVLFSVVVSGDPEPTISWYHNGNQLGSKNVVIINPYNCLSIDSMDHRDGGVYRMYARNSGGTAMDEFKLRVHDRSPLNRERYGVGSSHERELELCAAERYSLNTRELHHGLYSQQMSFDENNMDELQTELSTNMHSV